MSNFGDKVQPAVKKETKNVAIYTVVGVVVMWVGFLILHPVSYTHLTLPTILRV